MADYGGQDTTAKRPQGRRRCATSPSTARTPRAGARRRRTASRSTHAMKLVVEDAKNDPAHLVPALPAARRRRRSSRSFGRPKLLATPPAPRPARRGSARLAAPARRRRLGRLRPRRGRRCRHRPRRLRRGAADAGRAPARPAPTPTGAGTEGRQRAGRGTEAGGAGSRSRRPCAVASLIALVVARRRSALAHRATRDAHPTAIADDDDPARRRRPTRRTTSRSTSTSARSVPLDARFRTQDGTRRSRSATCSQRRAADDPDVQLLRLPDAVQPAAQRADGRAAGGRRAGACRTATGDVAFRVGEQFRIVTIDLEPNESLDEARARCATRYIDAAARDAARGGARTAGRSSSPATPGDGAAIRRVADAVGFTYTYIPERAEWAHPAALIFLSATGTVTRYVYGIEFEPAMMRESIFKAGLAEPATAVGFMNRCYHYDPDANSHARAGVLALRIGAAGFVVLLLSGFGVMHVVAQRPPSTPEMIDHEADHPTLVATRRRRVRGRAARRARLGCASGSAAPAAGATAPAALGGSGRRRRHAGSAPHRRRRLAAAGTGSSRGAAAPAAAPAAAGSATAAGSGGARPPAAGRQPGRARPGTTCSPNKPIEEERQLLDAQGGQPRRRRLRPDVLRGARRCRSSSSSRSPSRSSTSSSSTATARATRPSRRPAHNDALEITWTVIPTIIMRVPVLLRLAHVHPRRHAADQGRRDQRARVALELAVHARERRHRLRPPRPGQHAGAPRDDVEGRAPQRSTRR